MTRFGSCHTLYLFGVAMTKFSLTPLLLTCLAALPVMAQQNRQSQQNTQVASLQRQVKTLTEERDALKLKVDEIPSILKQENAELYRQLDEAEAQKERALAELEQLKSTLRDNQAGGDAILRELQQTRTELRNRNSRIELLEKEITSLQSSLDDKTAIREGALAHFGPDIIPAECLNLRQRTPSVKRASGVVVVNCLINELGEPVDVRLVQGLPGKETEWTIKAHEACIEAAKRLVFRPATTKDGNVRLKVWQGVGFILK